MKELWEVFWLCHHGDTWVMLDPKVGRKGKKRKEKLTKKPCRQKSIHMGRIAYAKIPWKECLVGSSKDAIDIT